MATMFPCPNCGGQLRYSIEDKKLKCVSCGSLVDVNEYTPDERINETTLNTNIFTCSTCGGEIQLIDNDGMEFCPFCGNQTVIHEKFSAVGAPKYIIPFSIGISYAIRIEQIAGYYECPNCNHKYIPTYKSVLFAMHVNRTRKMKCPNCGKKSWHKKVLK